MIDASEVFQKIRVENGAECVCTKTYIFNNTVTFYEGESYQVDLGTKKDSDLVAVIQPDYPAYVGMSKSRFLNHFQIKEKDLDTKDCLKSDSKGFSYQLERLKPKLELFLQKECDDYWSVHREGSGKDSVLTGKYAGEWRFSVEYDEYFYFKSDNLLAEIVFGICEIVKNIEKELEQEEDMELW